METNDLSDGIVVLQLHMSQDHSIHILFGQKLVKKIFNVILTFNIPDKVKKYRTLRISILPIALRWGNICPLVTY